MKTIESLLELELPLPDKTDVEHRADIELFRRNIALILKHKKRIIATPKYFFIRFRNSFLGSTITGYWPVPLGIWLLYWSEGKNIMRCPECEYSAFIFNASGSPLSGRNQISIVCADCQEISYIRVASFNSIFIPVFELRKMYPNKQVILRTKSQFFSWGKGLVGEETPDRLIRDCVHAVELSVLIDDLRTQDSIQGN